MATSFEQMIGPTMHGRIDLLHLHNIKSAWIRESTQQHRQSIVATTLSMSCITSTRGCTCRGSECDYQSMNNIFPTHKAEPLDSGYKIHLVPTYSSYMC